MSEPHFQHDLDTRGLRCPEPVMMLHRQMRAMAVGETVRVRATDPATERDIPQFCEFLGHNLLARAQEDEEYRYYICKASR